MIAAGTREQIFSFQKSAMAASAFILLDSQRGLHGIDRSWHDYRPFVP
jgi:hypothetical protein